MMVSSCSAVEIHRLGDFQVSYCSFFLLFGLLFFISSLFTLLLRLYQPNDSSMSISGFLLAVLYTVSIILLRYIFNLPM